MQFSQTMSNAGMLVSKGGALSSSVQHYLSTCGRYAGVENTETNRRDWRELLYTAPGAPLAHSTSAAVSPSQPG